MIMKKKSKFKHQEYLVQEGNKMILYKGHPKLNTSTRMDVTMAYLIGVRVGEKNYDEIELLNT